MLAVRQRGRVKTPTVLQMEAVECGPAALAIVLAHYGKHVPLERLRTECGVSRDGSTAAGILRGARAHGLEAKGFQMDSEPAHEVAPPFIAYWNFNHFLVVEGFGTDTVYLNDPSSGPRQITETEWDESFTGIVLTLAPTDDLEPGGRPPSSLWEVRERLTGSRPVMAMILLVSAMLALGGLALPGFQRVFVDRVLGDDGEPWAWGLAAAMAGVAVLLVAMTALQQAALLRLETRMALTTSGRFLQHVLHLPIEFFTQRQAADVTARVTSNDRIARLLSRDLATAVIAAAVALGYAVLLLTTDLLLAVIGIGFGLLNLVALRLVARMRKDATARLQQDRAKLTAATYNGISMIDTIKATGREDDYVARWSGLMANTVSGSQRLGVPTQVLGVVPLMLTTLSTATILFVGSHRALDGAITIGLLIAFQTLVANFTKPMSDLSVLGAQAQEVGADIARVRDVERYPRRHSSELGETRTEQVRMSGYLRLDRVSFGYSPVEDPFIEDFSLELRPGDRVALVGASGSGKSTLSRLIAGLLDPRSGEIRIDGIPREEIAPEVLAGALAYVDQDIVLFEGTIRDNLTLWDPGVTDRTLVEALRDVDLLEEVVNRPGRLNAVLREDGRDLSGGQRQRLEIARALAVDPSILVLDEATSALDPEREQTVHENIRRRGCACIVVAHRLSTIRDCDEIIVLDHGDVVERGTHADLMARDGAYADLVRAG